jgi:hypothetical protein
VGSHLNRWRNEDEYTVLFSPDMERRVKHDKLFEIVSAAVRDTIDAHPNMPLKEAHASLTKRIAGQLLENVRITGNEEEADSEELSGQQGEEMSELP